MSYFTFEQLAQGNSIPHRIDARFKVIFVLVFIFTLVGLKNYQPLLFALFFSLSLLVWAKIPLVFLGKKVILLVPFAGILLILLPFTTKGEPIFSLLFLRATREGFLLALTLGLRVLVTLSMILFLMTTTKFSHLLSGLATLHVPVVFIQTFEFTLRYIAVIIDESKNMLRARKSRGFGRKHYSLKKHTLKTLSQLIGLLFIRSYERGERVHLAMLSRGYTGEIKTLERFKAGILDWFWGVTILVVSLILVSLEKGWLIWTQ